jgi:TolB-like protein/thioredoxin-like negative regulator of GroEL
MNLIAELKRRNVFRVAGAYVVLSWLLLQIADTLGDALALPDWTSKLVILLLALGFIPAVVFSWVYELTPEGVKKESEIDRSQSITSQTGRKLDIAVLIILLGVVGLYFFDPRSTPVPKETPAPPTVELANVTEIYSIAVLPFEDFSADADQDHLARGIADTVLHMLAQASNLKVAARTSSFAYQGTNTPITDIARDLGVGAVLEGSVQRVGDRLRIIAQLIRASDQSHLWSETFDRTADDVFAIQDEIAQAVVMALRPGSAMPDVAPTSKRTDVVAYEHYLRGKEGREQGTTESVEMALKELDAAIEIDPSFVPALVELGRTYMALNSVTPRTWAEIEKPAEDSFRRAVELSPDDPQALSGIGMFIRTAGYDPAPATPYLERALSLNPNDVVALRAMADHHLDQGDVLLATDKIRRAYELDPNNPRLAVNYGNHLTDLGRFDQARAVAQRLLLMRPDGPIGHELQVTIESTRGRKDLAIPHALNQHKANPDSYYEYHQLANLYAQIGDQEKALDWYRRTPPEFQTEDYLPISLFMNADGIERLVAHSERDLVLYPGWDFGQSIHITYLFLSGKVAEGVAAALRYEEAYLTDNSRVNAAITGALARRLGENELADRLLDDARARTEQLMETEYLSVAVLFSRTAVALADNEPETALVLLQQIADVNPIRLRNLPMHPLYDPLREDPRFDELIEAYEREAAAQRQRLREQGL